jgi:hypothetical protein
VAVAGARLSQEQQLGARVAAMILPEVTPAEKTRLRMFEMPDNGKW